MPRGGDGRVATRLESPRTLEARAVLASSGSRCCRLRAEWRMGDGELVRGHGVAGARSSRSCFLAFPPFFMM